MKTTTRILAFVLAALLLAGTGMGPARAQTSDPFDQGDGLGESGADSLGALPDSLGALPDSLGGAAGDSVPPAPVDIPILAESTGIHPRFDGKVEASDTRIDLSGKTSLSISFPNRWSLGGDINYNQELPREIKREAVRTGFSLNTNKLVMEKVPLRLSVSRNYSKDEQNKGVVNYRRDETERSELNMGTSGGKALLPWLAGNLSTNVGISNQQTRNNQGLNRNLSNSMRQLTGHLDFKPVGALKMVTGFSGTIQSGTAQLIDITDQVESGSDSLQLSVDYSVGTKFKLNLLGGSLETDSERLDFKRDQYGSVINNDSTQIDKEKTLEKKWGGRFRADLKPSDRLSFAVSLTSQQDERRVRNSSGPIGNKGRDGDSQSVDLNMSAKPWQGQKTDISYKEGRDTSADFTADLEKKSRQLLVKASQELSKSFTLSGEAYFLLNQDFYANIIKNPQDRDQAQTRYTVTLSGAVTNWLKAGNTVQWFENRDILLHPTRSVASKDKRTLSWRTSLDYRFYQRFNVSQKFEVSVSEDDFYFTQDQNALDREYVVVTSSNVPLYGRIVLNFTHDFRKRELGGYLPDPEVPGHPKTFFKASREKKEFLRLGLSYSYRSYLQISVEDELGREVDFDYRKLAEDLASFGTLSFSMKYDQKLGSAGSLGFTLQHRAKFGRFVRENQRKLWLPSLSMSYNF